MSEYKLYNVTIEKEFVIAAPAELSLQEVEKSVENIMIIHNDSLLSEGISHVVAEELKTEGDLPAGWETGCLPYTNYPISHAPRELINKTIKEFLEDGTN